MNGPEYDATMGEEARRSGLAPRSSYVIGNYQGNTGSPITWRDVEFVDMSAEPTVEAGDQVTLNIDATDIDSENVTYSYGKSVDRRFRSTEPRRAIQPSRR
ncbi:MAG: hypothetical protein R3B96_01350 [Pirellulaceae bacterium]